MIKELIKFIEREAKAMGIAPSTFCLHAVNDGKLFKRLKEGRGINTRTIEAIEKYCKKPADKRPRRNVVKPTVKTSKGQSNVRDL